MKKLLETLLVLTIVLVFLAPAVTLAHQPRIVDNPKTNVIDLEISKAYYGQLKGEPHIYTINASKDFELYVNTLVPDIQGQKKDVSAEIFSNGLIFLNPLDMMLTGWVQNTKREQKLVSMKFVYGVQITTVSIH